MKVSFPIFSTIIAISLILAPGIPFIIGLLSVWLLIFGLSIINPGVAISSISLLMPFTLIARWKSPENILLSGFRTEIIAIFLLGFIFNRILSFKKEKERLLLLSHKLTLYLFILWSSISFGFHANGSLEFLLAIRENIECLMLFPVFVYLSGKDKDIAKEAIKCLSLATAFVALINIVGYFELISLPFDVVATRRVGIFESIHERTLFGMTIKRMNPLYGTGPGGGGLYFVSCGMALVVMGLRIRQRLSKQLLYFFTSSILFFAAFLTVSNTALMGIIFSLIAILIKYKNKVNKIIIIGIFVSGAFVFLTSSNSYIQELKYNSILDYFLNAFILNGFQNFDSSDFVELLFGKGLGLRTGGLIGEEANVSLGIDQSWFTVSNKSGIPALVFIFLFTVENIIAYTKISRLNRKDKENLILSGMIFFSTLSYTHSCPYTVPPLDYAIVASSAFISASKQRPNQINEG